MFNADIDRAYTLLAAAIIEQAIKDGVGRDFFLSDFYQLLTTNMPALQNGEAIYEAVSKNRKEGLSKGLHKEVWHYGRSKKRNSQG